MYANKVRMAYFWNKYNKAHYDYDRPPPRMVMGYKFSIYYNDLIDPTQTPTYTLKPIDELYQVIQFHAGPPYEDIAFKIVNKAWDRGRYSGFRSTFENGILQLNFNFRRMGYRR